MAKKRLLQRIKDDLQQQGLQVRTAAARAWLYKNLKSRNINLNAKRTFVQANNLSSKTFSPEEFIGRLFFFFYDAKLKKTLKYWDKFPLVIPIELYPDGFLGLNLHYIHPIYRARFLDKLESTLTDKRYDARTTMMINYNFLKKATKIIPPEAKPCIKRYLYSHMKSKFLPVAADDWDLVVYLPFEEYTSETRSGISKQQVWSDSQTQF